MKRKSKRSLRGSLRNRFAKDLRTPKYKPRVVSDKKKKLSKDKCKLKTPTEDEDQLDLDLELIPEAASNVKSFRSKKAKPNVEDISREELLEKGLETFVSELSNDAKGFFAMIFDQEGNPSIIWAGDMDMIACVGSLEVAKNELFRNIFAETF